MQYANLGGDKIAIRAALQQKYGSLMAILMIIEIIMFLIDLWMKHGITEPTEIPCETELKYVEYSDDDE